MSPSRSLPLPQGSGDGRMERVIREGIQKGLTKLAGTSEGKLALFNLALWKGDGFGKAFDDAIVDWVVWNTPDNPTEGSDHLADALYTTLVDYFQNKLAGDKVSTKPDEAKTELTRPDDGSTIGERKEQKHLQQKLCYVWDGEKSFIPQHSEFSAIVTIAGDGADTSIRDVARLVSTYHRPAGTWKKQSGKIESGKYIFDLHWYESDDGLQHEVKLKYRSEKKK